MSEEQTNGLSQLRKLQALQAQKKAQAKTSSMVKLENIVGVYLGTEPTEHFPKILDSNGNKVQEEKNGRKVDKRVNVQLMGAYKLGGLGYDIKSGNMYFIEKDTTITNY